MIYGKNIYLSNSTEYRRELPSKWLKVNSMQNTQPRKSYVDLKPQ